MGGGLHDWQEKWPPWERRASVPGLYDWTGLLQRVEEVAQRFPGRWIIHHDADEIRRAPAALPGATLAEALAWAQVAGFNAVQFHVRTYAPTDDAFEQGAHPELHFKHYLPEHVDHGLPHIKAWIQPGPRVDLHTHAGHQVLFEDRRVCPLPFLLKHYPIRGQAHGERKVLIERFPRYSSVERAKNWHVQYDSYLAKESWQAMGEGRAAPNFLRDPATLIRESDPVTIVTLTRFPEIFERLAASVNRCEPTRRRIVVTSGFAAIDPRWRNYGWEIIEGEEPFRFARNANLGIMAAGTDDVFLVNDDVQLLMPLIDHLAAAPFAITTPQVIGGINNRLASAHTQMSGGGWVQSLEPIPFVSVLLRRKMLQQVGLLDEGFPGYGGEDVEYCDRAQEHGFAMGVVAGVPVKHGYGDKLYSSSFFRVMSAAERNAGIHVGEQRRRQLAEEREARKLTEG